MVAALAYSTVLEAPSIGWQLFALDSSQCDRKAFVSSLDTYGTRLLTEALSCRFRFLGVAEGHLGVGQTWLWHTIT